MEEDLRAQLADVDKQLTRLRSESTGVTEQLSGGGAQDSEDRAAALTNLEESEALIANLEDRRQNLQERLDAQ